ncbi:3'-5' exonuclease [Oscillatoriales cyanobacterium USR001]|nr:3'-5' exonuclease [Oscillatoriales cyanobacterium USR001]
MPYLTETNDIKSIIAKFSQAKILWIDTEVADYKFNPKLSLIQVLDDSNDLTGNTTFILDVLEKPELAADFIDEIMVNSDIEKVMHNASYDIRFLGNDRAKNITCTLKLAKKIPYYILPVPNHQLKTLIEALCSIPNVDKEEQAGNWGKRPLTEKQLEYAKMDVVYLAQVHSRLAEIFNEYCPDSATENLTLLGEQYQEIESQWKSLDTEITEIKERMKMGMQAQKITDNSYFKLSSYTTMKVDFMTLVNLAENQGLELSFPITLTKEIQKQLGQLISHPSLKIEEIPSFRLTSNAKQRQKSTQKSMPTPENENLIELGERYRELLPEWRLLKSEVNHLKERVKNAMIVQKKSNTPHFKLGNSSILKVDFATLARLVKSVGIELDFTVNLTEYIKKLLGEAINQIDVQIEYINSWRMTAKAVEEDDDEDEIPF